jgi:hypothetical protein
LIQQTNDAVALTVFAPLNSNRSNLFQNPKKVMPDEPVEPMGHGQGRKWKNAFDDVRHIEPMH